MIEFFRAHLVEIFFVYGLAFFVTGVIVGLESFRSTAPQLRPLVFLSAFCLIHGSHEWFEMFQIIAAASVTPLSLVLRVVVLAVSFVLLCEYGIRTLVLEGWRSVRWLRWAILIVFAAGVSVVWMVWRSEAIEVWLAADAWCRYSLAVPGAVLAALGLFRQGRRVARQQMSFANDVKFVGLAFLFYGVPGQVFVGPSLLPPSNVLSTTLFLETFHFPVQLLRSAMACMALVFTVRWVRRFERDRQRRMEELDQARLEAQEQLNNEIREREALRKELLRQAVWAQEEERQHIARELHDEAGQALTALSWRLGAVEDALPDGSDDARHHLGELYALLERVMIDLRQLTTRLRPAVLDELGLVAAVISYADDCNTRFPFETQVEIRGQRRRLPSEVETTLYRVVQEAITNVAKHAKASRASIRLDFDEQVVTLRVSDAGVGMDVGVARQAATRGEGWGLAGIGERLELVGGHLDIQSSPGSGTMITVQIPLTEVLPFSEEGVDGTDNGAPGR